MIVDADMSPTIQIVVSHSYVELLDMFHNAREDEAPIQYYLAAIIGIVEKCASEQCAAPSDLYETLRQRYLHPDRESEC